MLKRARFYTAISLMIQSVSFLIMTVYFIFKNKRNTAGAFGLIGLLGGAAGIALFREEFKDRDILAEIDELVEQDKKGQPVEVPVDETASEAEFCES